MAEPRNPALVRGLDAFVGLASRAMAWLAGAALVLMALTACANMVLRAVSEPLKGSYELMGFLGAVAAAFALAYTQLHKGHIAVTILSGVFPRPVERLLDAVGSLASAVFFLIAARETFNWSLFLMETGELSETLRFGYAPFTIAVACGCLLMALALAADFLRQVLGREAEGGRK